MKGHLLTTGIQSVTKEWTKQRKSEEREASVRARRSTMWKPRRVSQTDACWHYLEDAYMRASGDNALPARARQVYYAIRDNIQAATGRPLDAGYFSYTLLPNIVARMGKDKEWNIVYDDRGHFQEPHGGEGVGLGTLNVRRYLQKQAGVEILTAGDLSPVKVTPYGPTYRYGHILYIEKEGFNELLEAVSLCHRYDAGLMSGKGQSTTAARELAEEFCSTYDMPLLLVHDFDRAGIEIAAVLQRSTRRYQFRKRFQVIDLGLNLADAEAYRLPSEEWQEKMNRYALLEQLIQNGATREEAAFILGGHRVELNAFTSPQFVEWLESKLDQAGVRKLVPEPETLEKVYRARLAERYFLERTKEVVQDALDYAETEALPDNLVGRVQVQLEATPAISWDEAVRRLVRPQKSETDLDDGAHQ
jgi:hypothetical protein